MFILRCTFWLSVMYASLTFGADALRSPHAFEAAVAGQASAAGAAVIVRATDWCVRQPDRCAQDAVTMNALVQAVASRDPAAEDEATTETSRGEVPLPVRDPRRDRRSMLTATH